MERMLEALKVARKHVKRSLDEIICKANKRDKEKPNGQEAHDVRTVNRCIEQIGYRVEALDRQIAELEDWKHRREQGALKLVRSTPARQRGRKTPA